MIGVLIMVLVAFAAAVITLFVHVAFYISLLTLSLLSSDINAYVTTEFIVGLITILLIWLFLSFILNLFEKR